MQKCKNCKNYTSNIVYKVELFVSFTLPVGNVLKVTKN